MKKAQTAMVTMLGLLAAGACATARIYEARSPWPRSPITIDGRADDWKGALAFVEDGALSLGFSNDRDNLYICVLAANETTRDQIRRGGLTVWFDPKGGRDKALGVRFPAGGRPGGGPEGGPMEGPTGGPPAEGRDRKGGFERPTPPEDDEAPEAARDEVEILERGDDAGRRVKLKDAEGLEIKIEAESGLLVYELRIPLAWTASAAAALDARPGATLGVGFETAIARSSGREFGDRGPGGGGGRPPGGMGGRPGGGGFGGFSRGRGPGGFEPAKPIKIWTAVQLASSASGQAAER